MPFQKVPKLYTFVPARTALLVTAFALALAHPLRGQQIALNASDTADVAAAELPDAPGAISSAGLSGESSSLEQQDATTRQTGTRATPPSDGGRVQTKRILFIIPNFRSVSADQVLPPQSAKEKFIVAGHDTFDYSSFLQAGVQAAVAYNSGSDPEFHDGFVGFGRYYWHTLADTAGENFMVGGVGPVLFRQDSRYYTLGHGSLIHRAGYAITRVAITRTDAGGEAPNFSEVLGAGAAAGAGTLYYPERDRTWTKVGQKWLTSVLIDGGTFVFKEFWPDVNGKFFHQHD